MTTDTVDVTVIATILVMNRSLLIHQAQRDPRGPAREAKDLRVARDSAKDQRALARETAKDQRALARETAKDQRALARETAKVQRAPARETAKDQRAPARETVKDRKVLRDLARVPKDRRGPRVLKKDLLPLFIRPTLAIHTVMNPRVPRVERKEDMIFLHALVHATIMVTAMIMVMVMIMVTVTIMAMIMVTTTSTNTTTTLVRAEKAARVAQAKEERAARAARVALERVAIADLLTILITVT